MAAQMIIPCDPSGPEQPRGVCVHEVCVLHEGDNEAHAWLMCGSCAGWRDSVYWDTVPFMKSPNPTHVRHMCACLQNLGQLEARARAVAAVQATLVGRESTDAWALGLGDARWVGGLGEQTQGVSYVMWGFICAERCCDMDSLAYFLNGEVTSSCLHVHALIGPPGNVLCKACSHPVSCACAGRKVPGQCQLCEQVRAGQDH